MKRAKIKNLLKNFYQISGMEIALFDNKFHTIISCKNNCNHFCRIIHNSSKITNICRESDIEHFKIVKETSSHLIYTCPFGFYTAIVPIMRNDEVVAYLSFAPAIEEKADCDNVILKNAVDIVPDIDFITIKESIDKIPHYSKEKLDAYSEIFMLIAKTIESDNLFEENEQSISYITKCYIDQNLSNKITLTELSYNLHCSTVTLTEHFKKDYGMSIMQYVTKKRMKYAEKLLNDKSLKINEISSLCGFRDVEYFSRTFKKFHNISPSEWRREFVDI